MLVDIIKKNNKMIFKTLMINKAKKLCRKLYDKNFLKNKRLYYPILEYVCGEIKTKKRMKLKIEYNIWYDLYGSKNIIRDNNLSRHLKISGLTFNKALRENSNAVNYLYNTNKLPDNQKKTYEIFMDKKLYYWAGCFKYLTNKGKRYTFKKVKNWSPEYVEKIKNKNLIFKKWCEIHNYI